MKQKSIKNWTKTRETQNAFITYKAADDSVTFTLKKNGMTFSLKMGEDRLNTLFPLTPYTKYHEALLERQHYLCADCQKPLSKSGKQRRLHHDPPLGSKGCLHTDFEFVTKNRILCLKCNKLAHLKMRTKV